MAEPSANPYDQVVYGSVAHAQTHPNRLATVAALYGMEAAPIENCRVLELGCSTGGNIIPMAYSLPDSQFLGIDYSARQTEYGQQQIAELGLKNVEVRQGDIREIPADLGEFDYIIAHGVYGWVPPDVQAGVLQVCGRHLAPRGVAFISFTAGPGGELRRIVRNMMLHHIEHGQSETVGRAARGREMADLLRQVEFPNAMSVIFRKPLERLMQQADNSLFHDQLNESYDVVNVQDLLHAAARHGLQYLGDADPDENAVNILPAELAEKAMRWAGPDRIAQQQYLDIVRFRQFRQTLLCRAECRIAERPQPEPLEGMKFLLARLRLAEGEWSDVRSDNLVKFEAAAGVVVVGEPLTKAILRVIENGAPHAQTFPQILEGCRKLLAPRKQDPAVVRAALLKAWCSALVEAHLLVPPIVAPGERPVSSPIIRAQVRRHMLQVTNLRHVLVAVGDPMARALLVLLDGSNDRPTLVEALARGLETGEIEKPASKQWPAGRTALRQQLARDLETSLRSLSNMAMLVE